MRVGVMTFFRHNYGAILQAYALQTLLESLGHDVEIIDYDPASHRNESLFSPWTTANGLVLNLFTLWRYPLFQERRRRIREFHESNMHISGKKYLLSADLEHEIPYDALICGSDQIWHPGSDPDRNRAYYLGFTSQKEVVKVSYAPSFGVSSLPAPPDPAIAGWLSDIPSLSVREETGRKIINQLCGREASIVLDPTLLLDQSQWDRVREGNAMESPYLLVYSTSQRGLIADLVGHLKKRTGLPVVVLSLYSLSLIPMADRVIYDVGPADFVTLFANAACVCTNSFHGTAFSVIYRKPFWCAPHNATNSRIADFLERIQLSARQVTARKEFPASPLDIDYATPASLLERERENSIGFLKRALGSPGR